VHSANDAVVGNGLAPFRLVMFAEGVKPLPYESYMEGWLSRETFAN